MVKYLKYFIGSCWGDSLYFTVSTLAILEVEMTLNTRVRGIDPNCHPPPTLSVTFDSTVGPSHLRIQPTVDRKQYFRSVGGTLQFGSKYSAFHQGSAEWLPTWEPHRYKGADCIYWKTIYTWAGRVQTHAVHGSIALTFKNTHTQNL